MLNQIEFRILKDIESKYYMQPMIQKIKNDISNQTLPLQEAFNHLYSYLVNCKDEVENLIQARIQRGEIKDASQARKSIAGGAFSNLIIWVFLKNKEQRNIQQNIFITSKISSILFGCF